MKSMKILSGLLFFLLSASIVFAQETCQLLVEQMIEETQLACSELDDNQACFGHRFIDGVWIVEGLGTKFLEPGDLVDTQTHQGYKVHFYDTDDQLWGIVLASIIPLPEREVEEGEDPQTISMVMFGSQEVWDATRSSPVRYEGTVLTTTNILKVAGDFGTGIYPAVVGEKVTITAQEPTRRFLRIIDAHMNAGWVDIGSISYTGDLSIMPMIDVIQGTDPSEFAPLQALYVDRILGDPSCVDVPPSGILVQTSDNLTTSLLINDVKITLSGTMYVSADAGTKMIIDVLEGQAFLKGGVLIPEGTRATMPLAFNYSALPPELTPYDMESVNKLPILLLDELIEPVAPLSQEDIDNAQGRG
jgi:hypothetical protein